MVLSLNISNIALITQCSINLHKGLNILSGETGAGKSIIIDSLTFVLGARADKSLIRSGESKAEVEAVFEVQLNQSIINCLNELGIEIETTIIISRTMTVEGRNECRINAKNVTLGMLRRLTSLLADIYGQHEHQALLDVSKHIDLVDNYGNLFSYREKIKSHYDELEEIKLQLDRYGSEAEISRKIDTLKYQIDEINNANIEEYEEEKLVADRTRYMSAEKIISGVTSAYNNLDGEEFSSVNAIATSISMLNSIVQYDDNIASLTRRLESVSIEMSDISSSLNDYINEFDYDEKKADYIERRIDEIRLLKRKYGHDLNEFIDDAQREYDMLINSSDTIESLNKQYDALYEKLVCLCEELSYRRKESSKDFELEILRELNDLGMTGTTFSVVIERLSKVSTSGLDNVELMISPNLGQPLKSLAKIISGGEMSRFMLAIKNITARLEKIDCMVFDEIDSGISGHIAQVVAEKLCNISRDRQVIAVTHLPQLASMADNHYLIEKLTKDNKAITSLNLLNDTASQAEIARLIGGSDYSGYAIPHAKEMIEYNNNYKLSFNS